MRFLPFLSVFDDGNVSKRYKVKSGAEVRRRLGGLRGNELGEKGKQRGRRGNDGKIENRQNKGVGQR